MMDDYLKEHMCATVRLRELALERLKLEREFYDGVVAIVRRSLDEDFAQLLTEYRDEHLTMLERLAEAEYRCRLLGYALQYALSLNDRGPRASDLIARMESLVLEAAVAA